MIRPEPAKPKRQDYSIPPEFLEPMSDENRLLLRAWLDEEDRSARLAIRMYWVCCAAIVLIGIGTAVACGLAWAGVWP